MGPRPIPVTLAMVSVLAVAGLAVLGWFLEPENGTEWGFRIIMLPALWGFLEFAQHRGEDRGSAGEAIMNWHRLLIAGVGLMTVMDLGFHLAISTDLLDADWEPRGQSVQGVFAREGGRLGRPRDLLSHSRGALCRFIGRRHRLQRTRRLRAVLRRSFLGVSPHKPTD